MVDEKVLVLDSRALSSLAFARSLGNSGRTVHVGESFRGSITSFSRYTSKRHIYPSSDENPSGFQDWILKCAKREQYDFIVAMRDATTQRLSEIQNKLPEKTQTLLAPPEKIHNLNDKGRCAKLAERVGVPIPTTYYPSETSINEIAEQADFPVLAKPTIASGSRGIVRVESPQQLAAAYESVTEANSSAIIQEFVDHSGGHFSVGTVFDRNSDPRAVHVYKELRQYPDSGGPAIEAVSVETESWVDDILEILRAIDWVGPAHIDVLLDPDDGTYKLLEVNPRIWSSINLTVQSGVDVPRIVMELASEKDPDPVTSYRTDVRYRWVLPNEFLWLASGDQKVDQLRQLVSPRAGETCYGILSIRDPKAAVGVFAQSISFMLDKEKRNMVLNRE
jgi:predicted ATP-grasp superfamily ATP-dependent carboligase